MSRTLMKERNTWQIAIGIVFKIICHCEIENEHYCVLLNYRQDDYNIKTWQLHTEIQEIPFMTTVSAKQP